MIKLIVDKIPRIIKLRKKLAEKLGVNITNNGKEISIEGEPEKEYIAEKVIQALDFGFPYAAAILIQEQDFIFEIINIKDYTKRYDKEVVRGRIIGKGGKTLKTLSSLTQCYFELKDNRVGIVCDADNFEVPQQAVISLIQGSKTSNVYKTLERNRPKPVFDLGLKR